MRLLLISFVWFLVTQATLGTCTALPAHRASASPTVASPAASSSLFVTNPDSDSDSDSESDAKPWQPLQEFEPPPTSPSPEEEITDPLADTSGPSTPGGPLYVNGRLRPIDLKGLSELAAAIQAVAFIQPELLETALGTSRRGFKLFGKAKNRKAVAHLAHVTVKLPRKGPYRASWQIDGQRVLQRDEHLGQERLVQATSAAWWPGAIEGAVMSVYDPSKGALEADWALETLTGDSVHPHPYPSKRMPEVLRDVDTKPTVLKTKPFTTVLSTGHAYVLQEIIFVGNRPNKITLFDTALGTGREYAFRDVEADIHFVYQS